MKRMLLMYFIATLVLFSCATTSKEKPQKVIYPDSYTSQYVLPFGTSIPREVIQGNASERRKPWTHYDKMEFAYDFRMPIGSEVLASRAGMVMFIRDEYSDDDHENSHGNVMVILHEDGTAALYGHIKQNGSLVKLYSIVTTGTPIALSGNSGESPEPHLHFQVNENGDFSKSKSIPISLMNSGVPGELLVGSLYPK